MVVEDHSIGFFWFAIFGWLLRIIIFLFEGYRIVTSLFVASVGRRGPFDWCFGGPKGKVCLFYVAVVLKRWRRHRLQRRSDERVFPLPPERQALAVSTFKKSARPPSSAAVAAAAAAKRKNDATQIAIAFQSKTKYPVGMKILLSDRIYGSPSQVRVCSGFPFYILSNNLLTFLLSLLIAGTRVGAWTPF